MLSKAHSGAVYGADEYSVELEVNSGGGDVPSPRLWNTGPQTVIVGLPDALRLRSGQAAVKESKDRVHTAIVNSRLRKEASPYAKPLRRDKSPWHAEFDMPKGRLTVNLAPADIKKEGPSFDLPIAMGVLATKDDVSREALKVFAMVEELALNNIS